ncbi:MAG TPA: AmmeMemoRadiSam system protein A [Anaerolineae bacterium]|nr:AmmeMemoRadiSam system protein A [Anaerolineae bacterium]
MTNFDLTAEQKRELLQLARRAIARFLTTGKLDIVKVADPALRRDAGVFVTLWRQHDERGRAFADPTLGLRGCIGHVEADQPLFQVVQLMAVSAATNDPRFAPVAPEELPDIRLEISVLSPLFPIRPEEIEVGKHGLVIETGRHRGLLLPEVPMRRGWGREEFLEALCYKAGLSEGCWQQPGAKLYGFTAVTFEEE